MGARAHYSAADVTVPNNSFSIFQIFNSKILLIIHKIIAINKIIANLFTYITYLAILFGNITTRTIS
jgi:hypothetical protein